MTETEPRAHDLEITEFASRRTTTQGKLLRGKCSCGDVQVNPVATEELVRNWHADHVNRFPTLTRAIVIASSMASREMINGREAFARHRLSDARKMAQELRRMAPEPLRDAEALALSLYERAVAVVTSSEEPPDCPG